MSNQLVIKNPVELPVTLVGTDRESLKLAARALWEYLNDGEDLALLKNKFFVVVKNENGELRRLRMEQYKNVSSIPQA